MGRKKANAVDTHAEHLAKRREYYSKNKEYIRKRDNENAKKKRELDPELYRERKRQYRIKKTEMAEKNVPPLTFYGNPDRERILERVFSELEEAGDVIMPETENDN